MDGLCTEQFLRVSCFIRKDNDQVEICCSERQGILKKKPRFPAEVGASGILQVGLTCMK